MSYDAEKYRAHERTKLALKLLDSAEKWRTSYDRAQVYSTDSAEIYKHDETMTAFGDDAFDILMAYTS